MARACAAVALFTSVLALTASIDNSTVGGRSRRLGRPHKPPVPVSEIDQALRTVVTPLMGYYISDFYYGDGILGEAFQYADVVGDFATGFPSATKIDPPSEDGDTEATRESLLAVQRFDAVYVQVNAFESFAADVLPLLEVEVVLVTGQRLLPQIHRNALSLEVLGHPRVAFWLAQNPVFAHRKYGAIPYGVAYAHAYLAALERLEAREEAWRLASGRVTREAAGRAAAAREAEATAEARDIHVAAAAAAVATATVSREGSGRRRLETRPDSWARSVLNAAAATENAQRSALDPAAKVAQGGPRAFQAGHLPEKEHLPPEVGDGEGGGGRHRPPALSLPLAVPPRNGTMFLSFINKANHYSRIHVPQGTSLPNAGDFYDRLAVSQYVSSPRGDRPDCFRHLEAIGLGCVPISNIPWFFFKDLYGSSMLFAPQCDGEDRDIGGRLVRPADAAEVRCQGHNGARV